MVPGLGRQLRNMQFDENQAARGISQMEAIILSMTPDERRNPRSINGSRRRRIAAGSGTTVQHVNQVLGQHKQMEKMMKQMKAGKMPNLGALMGR